MCTSSERMLERRVFGAEGRACMRQLALTGEGERGKDKASSDISKRACATQSNDDYGASLKTDIRPFARPDDIHTRLASRAWKQKPILCAYYWQPRLFELINGQNIPNAPRRRQNPGPCMSLDIDGRGILFPVLIRKATSRHSQAQHGEAES